MKILSQIRLDFQR